IASSTGLRSRFFASAGGRLPRAFCRGLRIMRTGRLSISTLFFALLTTTAFHTAHAEEEWSRFRGPNGQGQSEATTIPTTWTEADYNWKIELPGIGHSS